MRSLRSHKTRGFPFWGNILGSVKCWPSKSKLWPSKLAVEGSVEKFDNPGVRSNFFKDMRIKKASQWVRPLHWRAAWDALSAADLLCLAPRFILTVKDQWTNRKK